MNQIKHLSAPATLLALSLALTACKTEPAPSSEFTSKDAIKAPTKALPFSLKRAALGTEEIHGVSGLTRAPDGLWYVTERQRTVGKADVTGKIVKTLPLRGIPQGLDTEGLAFLPDGRLAIGTESLEERSGDRIFIAEIKNDEVAVVEELTFDYSHWNTKAPLNRGIEALCTSGPNLVVGAEFAMETDGKRYAAVGAYNTASKAWSYARLVLTTPTGRLSSLACKDPGEDGKIELLGIERHFGVGRVLSFTFPKTEGDMNAELVLDLATSFDDIPNFEGVEIIDDKLVLVTDNHYGGRVRGPSMWLVATPKPKS